MAANNKAAVATVSTPPKVLELRRILAQAAQLPELGGTAGAIVADIQARILNADTADAIFEIANSGAASVGDWVDKPVEIQDFRVLSSAEQYRTDDYSLGAYLAIAFTDLATGEQKVMTAGGEILVTLLWRFREIGALPLRCAFTETQTSNNYTVHKLRPLTDFEKSALAKSPF